MVSFYPGPSKVYKKIPTYVTEAYEEGILSINHRSDTFISLSSETHKVLRDRLKIPADYMIFFTSSATECWEIIAQSLPNTISYHFYSGAFGEKWFRYTQKLKKKCIGYHFIYKQPLDTKSFDLHGEPGLICLTQNETSNGTQVPAAIISVLRKKYPDHLLALDVTSSLGGVNLPIGQGDIWYASVQKCLGLPAGMGIMICSPKAIEAVLKAKENKHYNSLLYMREMMKDYQTTYTPNVLGIYLLKRTQQAGKDINDIHVKTIKRAKKWYKLLDKLPSISPLVKLPAVRSDTVITCSAQPDKIKEIKQKALEQGIIIGNGYGELKANTFRIANFPAHKGKEIKQLKALLKSFS